MEDKNLTHVLLQIHSYKHVKTFNEHLLSILKSFLINDCISCALYHYVGVNG